MHAFQTAASAFCIACIWAEITTLLAGAGWAGRCIKAVAGLYILVILFRLAPQMKLELKSAAAAAPAGSPHRLWPAAPAPADGTRPPSLRPGWGQDSR